MILLLWLGPVLGAALLVLAELRNALYPEPEPIVMDWYLVQAIQEVDEMFPEHPPIAFPGRSNPRRRSSGLAMKAESDMLYAKALAERVAWEQLAAAPRASILGQHGACRRSLPARQVRSLARMS